MENPVSLGRNLQQAVVQGNLERVKELINQGADVNYINEKGFTPLLFAIGYADTEIVRELLNANANVNYITPNNFTSPLCTAIVSENKEKFDLVINHPSLNENSINHHFGHLILGPTHTPLILAVQKLFAVALQPLLDKGADVNATDNKGKTALMNAMEHYYKKNIRDRIKFDFLVPLYKNGASLTTVSNDGETPLKMAVRIGGDTGLVDFILLHGTGVGAASQISREDIKEAITYAQEFGNKDIIYLLQLYLNKKIQGGKRKSRYNKRKNTRKNRKTRKSIKKRV